MANGHCGESESLERALKKCLEIIHNYFGLTEVELDAAIKEAKTNPKWSPYDSDKWHKIAYPANDNLRHD